MVLEVAGMALNKKKTDANVTEKEYEGRCKMRVYDSVSDWKKQIQSDKPIDPMTHIEDLYLRCDFDRDFSESILKVNIRVRNLLEEKIPIKIKLFLHENVDQVSIDAMDIRMVAQGRMTTKGYFEVPIKTIKFWSDQEPNLYEVLVVMTDHLDEIIQVVGLQYGFREIKIRGEKILMNNKPLLIRGINYGGDLKNIFSKETFRKDLMLLKQYNINALKVSIDSIDHVFFECCNQLGFYVVVEVNSIESNKEGTLLKAASLIGKMRNHPCIIMWSLESALNKKENIEVKKVMLSLDDRRPYMMHSEEDFLLSDVFVMEKFHEKTIERIGKGLDIRGDMVLLADSRFSKGMDEYTAMAYKKKPALLCTNRQMGYEELINLKPVMDSMHTYTRWHGGFVGNFMNYFSYQSPSGEKSFEIQPLAYEIKRAFEPYVISFDSQTAFYSIKNLNLLEEDIDVRVIIQEDGTPIVKEYLDSVSVKPGEVTSGVIKSWLQLKNETVLYHIIFEVLLTEEIWWAKKEHIIASKQFEREGYHPVIYMPKSSIDCIINETNQSVEVISEKTHYEFDKNTGYITQIKVDNKALLAQPIQPIWRSLSDLKTGIEAAEAHNNHVKAYRIDRKGSQVDLYFEIKIKAMKTLLLIKYEIFSTGELSVYYEGEADNKLDRLGSTMTLPAIKNQVNWFGRGPYPSYLNSMTSAQMGLYQMDLYEINHEGMNPIKPGTYKDVRWMTLTGTDGEGIMVESLEKNGFNASLATLDQGTTTLLIDDGNMTQNGIGTLETSTVEKIKHTCSYRFLFMEAYSID
jgi:beta-galactosidase/beta-glucuronidase